MIPDLKSPHTFGGGRNINPARAIYMSLNTKLHKLTFEEYSNSNHIELATYDQIQHIHSLVGIGTYTQTLVKELGKPINIINLGFKELPLIDITYNFRNQLGIEVHNIADTFFPLEDYYNTWIMSKQHFSRLCNSLIFIP